MADVYTYKARDRSGKVNEGSLEGDSKTLVASRLRQMGFVPIAIDKKASSGLNKSLSIPGLGPKVKLKDLAIFSRQFATMVNSGLTLLRSLSILAEQTENKALAKVVNEVRQDVEKGSSLSQGLARHPKTFNKLYIAMVKAGETGGVLDEVLTQLANTIEKQLKLRQKIKAAMTYPVAVLGLVLLILSAMLIFVVPMFATMYESLGDGPNGAQLPLPTRILVGISELIVRFFPFIVVLDIAALVGFKKWIQTDGGRARWDSLKLRVPILGGLVHKTALVRFSRTLSVLLRSGVPILESLEITSDTVGNTVAARAVHAIASGVKTGESITRPLHNHSVFPPMVVQMMAVGEETGALDEMLDKIAEFYEQEVESLVESLTSLLEPMLIVFLGGAVGSMVVALYMPMFNMIKLIE